MTHTSTGSLRGKILELAARTGTTPAEALEAAVQDKLEVLDDGDADFEAEPGEVERDFNALIAAEELYAYDYDSDYD